MRRICAIVFAFAAVVSFAACKSTVTPTTTPLASPTLTRPVSTEPAQLTPTPTPTPRPTVTPMPTVLPDGTTVDLGIPVGDTYFIASGALDPARGLVYALGQGGEEDGTGSRLAMADLAKGTVSSTVTLTATYDSFAKILVSADGSRLYIASSGSTGSQNPGLLMVSTGVVSGKLGDVLGGVPNVRAMALDSAGGLLYVLDTDHLRRLNAQTLAQEVAASIPEVPPVPPVVLIAVNAQAGRLYISQQNDMSIGIYRTDDLTHVQDLQPSGQVIQLVSNPDLAQVYAVTRDFAGGNMSTSVDVIEGDSVATTIVSDAPFYVGQVVVDAATDRVILLEDELGTTENASEVRIVSPDTFETVQTFVLPYLNLQYARSAFVYEDMVYRLGDFIQPIGLTTGQPDKPIYLGILLAGATVDEATDRLFVVDSTGTVHVVDTVTFKEVYEFPGVLNPGLSTIINAPPTVSGDRLFVPAFAGPPEPGTTLVLNASTGEQIASIPRAGQVTVDAARNRIYVTNQGVYTVDGATYQITGTITETVRTSQFSGVPGAVEAEYDAEHDLLFVTMNNNAPGSSNSGFLYIYDGATLTRVDQDIQTDRQFVNGLAIGKDTIWLSGGFPGNDIQVFGLDGVVQTHLDGLGAALFLDEARGRLYTHDWVGLVTLDTTSRNVIGYRSLSIQFPGMLLYDTARHRLYATSTESANVTLYNPDFQPPAQSETLSALPDQPVQQIAIDAGDTMLVVSTLPSAPTQSVFRAQGQGWIAYQGGLPERGQLRIVAAPDEPGTFFAFSSDVNQPFGLFRSTDGSATWSVADAGLTNFVVQGVALSPTFGLDGAGLLWAPDGIYETVDGGNTWAQISDLAATQIAAALGPSDQPTFVVLAGDPENGAQTLVYSFTTGAQVLDQIGLILVPPSFFLDFALSPNFGVDGVGVAAVAQTGLYLTEDGGRTWRAVGPMPQVFYPSFTILFANDFVSSRTVYVLMVQQFFGPRDEATLLRSTDGGRDWESSSDFNTDVLSVAEAPDGTLWMGDHHGHVQRLDPDTLAWEPSLPPTPTPTPPPPATPAPTPTQVGEGSPPPGLFRPQGAFADVWGSNSAVRQALGWAAEPQPHDTQAAVQFFQSGTMIWRQDLLQIYALYDDDTWASFDDTWTSDQPESDPSIVPPAGLLQPVRGFGKVWRNNPDVRSKLGWALQNELAATATVQLFERGLIIRVLDTTYVLERLPGAATWLTL